MPSLEGILCPTVTFFTAKGEVDLAAFRRHLGNLVDRGLHGIAPLGTMGEFTLLDARERRTLAEAAVESVGEKGLVMVGTGSTRTATTVELSRHAEDVGAHAVLVVTPFYLRPNREGLRRHYGAVRRAVEIPLLAYNLPSFTGYGLENDLVAELAGEGILQGMKDSEGNLGKDLDLLSKVPNDFALFTGADPLCLALVAQGAAGGILGTSNLFPAKVTELYRLARGNELDKAAEIQAGVARLSEAIQTGPFPAATKYMVERVWGLSSALRLPVTELSDGEKGRIDSILDPFLGKWR